MTRQRLQYRLLLALCGLWVAVSACRPGTPTTASAPAAPDPTQTITMTVGSTRRSYVLHTPPRLDPATPASLVLVFHGSGGTGAGTLKLTHFNDVADAHGFLVAYPDGIDKHWNIGADAKSEADDLAFVSAMLDQIGQKHPLDTKRIYAAGMSNGGFFCIRLACEMSDRFAAIATVGSGFLDDAAQACKPDRVLPLFMLNGDADPLIPFGGGNIRATRFRKEDSIRSAESGARFWAEAAGCNPSPETAELPSTDQKDETRISTTRYSGGKDGAIVELFTIHGGGHTWPGGYQYLSERLIGKTSRQIDASEEIWRFFSNFPRRPD